MSPRDPRIPEIRAALQDLSHFIGTLEPPQIQEEVAINSLLAQKKAEIFAAIDDYNGVFFTQESSKELATSMELKGIQASKKIIKLTIEVVIREVGLEITRKYAPVYVKELCASSSRIIEEVLKEKISREKVVIASCFLKYLGEISKTVVLPSLLELNQNIEANEPDLGQYFCGLNANIIGLISSQKATEKETSPLTLSWGEKTVGIILGVACGSYLVKSFYDVFKSGNSEVIKAAAAQLSVIKCIGATVGCLTTTMLLSIPYVKKENWATFSIACEEEIIKKALEEFKMTVIGELTLPNSSLGSFVVIPSQQTLQP